MKKIIFILILIIVCYSLYAENLTNEQITQIIRNFENNQNISGLKISYNNEEDCYRAVIHNNILDQSWQIKNGEVCMTLFYNNCSQFDPNITQENANYSFQQCDNIANEYLHSKNISTNEYDAPTVVFDGGEYQIGYRKKICQQPLIFSRSHITVDINATTGKISCFKKRNYPEIIIIEPPSLSDMEMQQIVSNSYDINNLNIEYFPYTYNYVGTGIERCAFLSNGVIIHIDAYNHNVTAVDVPGYGANNVNVIKKSPYILPVEFEKNHNITLKDIESYLHIKPNTKDNKTIDIQNNYSIDKKDKDIARMEVNGKKFIFRNGSYWCFINNKTYNMDGNCIIKDGKLQLPEEFYKKVQTKDYDFFQKSQKSITN